MRKNLYLLAILFFTKYTVHSQTISRQEILGKPTDTSVTLKMFFSTSAEVAIQFGTTSGNYSQQTNWQTFAANDPVEITINGLQPDTKYFYAVIYRNPGDTNFTTKTEHSFHTQRQAGSSFVYVVQADPHLDASSDTALYQRCLQNQLEDNPDFMIDLGDFLMTDKLKNTTTNLIPHDTITYRCNLLRSYYENICHSVPLFIALGNHEGEAGWNLNGTANNIAVWNTQERQKFFLNPGPDSFYSGDSTIQNYVGPNNTAGQRKAYYSWTWGDALFVVLDPYWYTNPKPTANTGWNWSLGLTQYNWLKTTLENSTAKFKFIFAHQIVGGDAEGRGGIEYANKYEWGGMNSDGITPAFTTNRPGWYKPIKDVLTENHVTIFFHGHDHFFDKQDKDCLVYQETPQPSLPNFNYPSQAATYGYLNGQIVANSGHLRITVGASQIQVDYVRAYLPASENGTRHNKDVSASYTIPLNNCYSLSNPTAVIWNSNYADEIVYPNPLTTSSKIEFTLKKADRISIYIYNELGQMIKNLVTNNSVSEGNFQVLWDGKDDYEIPVSNGTYIYKIIGENGASSTGKIIVTK
ncbi:T9SS type A sorting domain-containing protein [Flavobacterium aciduliphilum]|uniref:Putative secreted protein (Por secretion system target) n=1 Tax=Flavobacterium aciduliphilum TaxID=1101402 RepID=A0A328YQU6_9FLAO|nr:T9SS type A sorting domain-containing protein [Flavobacterium aciduliphilum]RAR75503.1 putative secreted protein (Por secretion system target) [Flavobacterium aciduliphilum]